MWVIFPPEPPLSGFLHAVFSPNLTEFGLNSNPCNADSDGDTMPDGWENTYKACVNILAGDSLLDGDTDSLSNKAESTLGSNPCSADTDGDGMEDGWENSYDCVDILVGDSLLDADTDGYTNLQEFQQASDPCVFTDLTPPVITIVEPQDGMTTNPTISIHITYSDVGLGADTTTLMVYHNDVDITPTLTVGETSATGSVSGSGEGGNLIRAYIEDLAGLSAEDSALVLVESGLPPVIWFVTPQDGQTVYTNTPYIRIEYEDPGSSGVNPATVVILLDGLVDLTANFMVTAGFAEWWSTAESSDYFSNGWHTLEAWAEDYYGNLSSPATVTFLVNFSGTNPVIVSLAPDFTVGGDTITITGMNFGNTVEALFPGTLGPVAADSVWVHSSTEMVAKVPGSVISGKVSMRNLLIVSSFVVPVSSNTVEFTYGLPYAYITNRVSNQVAVLDYTTPFTFEKFVAIGAGTNPYAADVTPDGRYVFIVNRGTTSVTVLDVLDDHTVEKTFTLNCNTPPTPANPESIAISPDGSRAFVGSASSKVISVIEIRKVVENSLTGAQVCQNAVSHISRPEGSSAFRDLEFSPDGQRVLVATNSTVAAGGNILSIDSLRYYMIDENSSNTYLTLQPTAAFQLTEPNARVNPVAVGFLYQRLTEAGNPWWGSLIVNLTTSADLDEDSVLLRLQLLPAPITLNHFDIVDTNKPGHPICYGGVEIAISPLEDRAFIGFNYSNNLGFLENLALADANSIEAATAARSGCPPTCSGPGIREVAYTPYLDKVIATIWWNTAAESKVRILDASTANIPPGKVGTITTGIYDMPQNSNIIGPEGIGVWPHFDRDGDKISDLIEAANAFTSFLVSGNTVYLNPVVAESNTIIANIGQPVGTYTTGSLRNGILLPEEGIGFRHFYGGDPNHDYDHWGTLQLVKMLEAVGREWNQSHPEGPRISIGDLSKRLGGGGFGHDSHYNGKDVDVRYVLDGSTMEGPMDFCNGQACNHTPFPQNYNQSRSQELVNLFIKLGASLIIVDPATGIPTSNVVTIDGNTAGDDPCGDWVNNKCDGGRGHSHHFHVRIP
jgi:hypothetical protein